MMIPKGLREGRNIGKLDVPRGSCEELKQRVKMKLSPSVSWKQITKLNIIMQTTKGPANVILIDFPDVPRQVKVKQKKKKQMELKISLFLDRINKERSCRNNPTDMGKYRYKDEPRLDEVVIRRDRRNSRGHVSFLRIKVVLLRYGEHISEKNRA